MNRRDFLKGSGIVAGVGVFNAPKLFSEEGIFSDGSDLIRNVLEDYKKEKPEFRFTLDELRKESSLKGGTRIICDNNALRGVCGIDIEHFEDALLYLKNGDVKVDDGKVVLRTIHLSGRKINYDEIDIYGFFEHLHVMKKTNNAIIYERGFDLHEKKGGVELLIRGKVIYRNDETTESFPSLSINLENISLPKPYKEFGKLVWGDIHKTSKG